MALQGNYKYYTNEVSDTETETSTITIPEDIPEWNPDYEFRGQTIDREYPKNITTEHIIENCYVMIISFMFHKRYYDGFISDNPDLPDLEGKKDEGLDLHYRVYESKEARDNKFNEFLHEEHLLGKLVDLVDGSDIRTLGYELLKQQAGFENMQDSI